MRPTEWVVQFHNVLVRVSGSEYETVDVRKYLMGMRSWNEYQNVYARVRASRTKPPGFVVDAQALNRAYTGKGTPQQLGHALDCAVIAGVVKPNAMELQRYADQWLGVDCTGFTSGYLVTEGRISSDIWHLPALLMNRTRYPWRTRLNDIAPRDLMIWATVDPKTGMATEVKSNGVGHAVLIDTVFQRGGANSVLVQAAESNATEGPVASAYEIEMSAPAGQWTARRTDRASGGRSPVVIVRV
jgi:hypothetical protein